MTTDAAIIAEAKEQIRVNTTELDTYALNRLNRIYRSYCRKENWPQLLVTDQTITVTTDQNYALPADFDRFANDTLFYDVDASGNVLGGSIPVSYSGSGLEQYQFFSTTVQPALGIVVFVSGAPKLKFYPHFTSTASKTVSYSYYKAPTTLTGAGVVIEVDQLEETLLAALCKDLIRFHGLNGDSTAQAQYFAQQEKAEYRTALRSLYTSPFP